MADKEVGNGNLRPFPKGVSGNPKGRPKGVKNLSTVVQQLLADEDLIAKIIGSKHRPEYWDFLPKKNGANALVAAMMIKSLQGDTQAANWIRKSGYGDKLTHEFEEGLFQNTKIEVEIVKSKITDERDTESQLSDS